MNSKNLFSDLRAGVVVFLVALPLCLGISLACGVPLFSGLIAGVVGGIVVTSISGAKYSVSGPAAGLTAIVVTAISELGSFEAFLAAVTIAGIIQIVLGLLKAGGVSNFIPNSVIKGMLAGIGIILIMKQLPHLVGYDADPEGDMYFLQSDGHNSISDLYYMLNYITPGSVLIGLVSFAVLLITEMRFFKNDRILSSIPGPLLAVIFGILLTISFSSSNLLRIEKEHLVNLPLIQSAADLKSNLLFPDYSLLLNAPFWLIVFTLAIVASLETLLNIEALEKLDPLKAEINTSRELIAQGTGNLISGFIGGLPITSVVVRSSANIHAGAKTKLSVILHAVLLLFSALFLHRFLALIPNSSLAAILIMTGYKLTKISLFKKELKMGKEQFLPFIVTIVVMLLTDLLKGVGAGIVVAVFFIIKFNIQSTFEIIEEVIDGKTNYLVKLPQHVTFFNKGFVINYLNKVKNGSTIIIDGSINKTTDKDVKEVFIDFIHQSRQRNIEVQFVKYSLIKEHGRSIQTVN